ncbi:DNA-binding transcriptional ArsR family regulator [Actinoplanes octamycinicus]|uniref:DNA-binding transcriptional ArsR family regulator n=1 Tax=Actinoplanes octamycinicus TaxID=135948 RepID=A0A7W7M8S7_9ACTN|nr:helix-turn-helix domain-containing protein [Actinoplanes octamycinicus]MBB4741214.1 DNA-binding transcriptional ArsR family regulator [Actinoplanes octamycinicus]GIE56120.1 transcriptional regulator [Actinoplanes octamycinicus]
MPRPRAAARIITHPEVTEVSLQQLLEALVDPVRRSIVVQLTAKGAEMACGSFDTSVSDSTLTHHFNVLREAGVIRQWYSGTTKLNALRADELETRFPGVLTSVVAAETR